MNWIISLMAARPTGAQSWRRLPALVAAFTATFALAAPSWAATDKARPAGTRPMTAVEVFLLYRDRSWQWADGAGFMQREDRVFKAWTGSGPDASWAEGHWKVSAPGQLCMLAGWHKQGSVARGKTCFIHRTDGHTIYQKKEPSGAWYVFRHAEPQQGDEFTKLIPGDVVSEKLEAMRNPARLPDRSGAVAEQLQNGRTKGAAQ